MLFLQLSRKKFHNKLHRLKREGQEDEPFARSISLSVRCASLPRAETISRALGCFPSATKILRQKAQEWQL